MAGRREFLRTGFAAAGVAGVSPSLQSAMPVDQQRPRRFIFIHKGNGLPPATLVPPSFSEDLLKEEKQRNALEVDLDGHDLPDWMNPLAAHRESLTILQGLSGKMCTTGHHTWCSSLGVYKANERLSSIKWATVDFELARLFPSPFEHIEFACFPAGGGNARGNINGIEKGFSARGPEQPNYAFGSPKVAVEELFRSVSADPAAQARYQLERQLLQFAGSRHRALSESVRGAEHRKVSNYADALRAMERQGNRIDAMGDVLRQHMPELDDRYLSEQLSTVDRQNGFTEVLLSVLISGMTNVVTLTIDELGTNYTGLPGIEGISVNQHDVGHGKPVAEFDASTVRRKIRTQHMHLINNIVTRLKSVPEGGGTMFDNTMLFYFPDNGETHHSNGSEWPFVVLSGCNTPLDIRRRYLRLPGYNQPGHKTLGNWYTTLLNACGHPINHFGAPDPGLSIPQTGPIESLLS